MTIALDTHTNPNGTERLRIPGVAARGKDAWAIGPLPARLFPVRDLLTSQDPHDRAVLDDWIESQDWNVAHDLWLLTKPTTFQKRITLMVIGRGTHAKHYPNLVGNEKVAPSSRYWVNDEDKARGLRLFRLAEDLWRADAYERLARGETIE